ncbi:MAG: SPOR domain-containing protein [Gammaproteobacteria bacterium]|jgi:DedD protein
MFGGMDTRLKERMVGFVVLFLLVVIFVPMFFHDSGKNVEQISKPVPIPARSGDSDSGVAEYQYDLGPGHLSGEQGKAGTPMGGNGQANASPAPNRRTPSSATAQPDPSSESAAARTPDSGAADTGKTASTSKSAPNPPTSEPKTPDTAPQDSGVGHSAEASPQVAEQANASSGQLPSTARHEPTPDGAWTVQVGSFSAQSNADKLVARLKDKSYPAYVSRYRSKGRTLYRVRVGGFDSRDAASALAKRLKHATGLPATPLPSS